MIAALENAIAAKPLRLNLYQAVKGLSTGARILKPGGTLIIATECREGVPAGGPCDALRRSASGPEELLARLEAPGFSHPEQWQAQIQALAQRKAEVLVHSSIPDDALRAPFTSIRAATSASRSGSDWPRSARTCAWRWCPKAR